jgi:hypothetical protein
VTYLRARQRQQQLRRLAAALEQQQHPCFRLPAAYQSQRLQEREQERIRQGPSIEPKRPSQKFGQSGQFVFARDQGCSQSINVTADPSNVMGGQTVVRLWSDGGQTAIKHQSKCGLTAENSDQTLVKWRSNGGQTEVK